MTADIIFGDNAARPLSARLTDEALIAETNRS